MGVGVESPRREMRGMMLSARDVESVLLRSQASEVGGGQVVRAFDVRSSVKEQILSVGAEFLEVEVASCSFRCSSVRCV
eukprot:2289509-Rhodomonas_salina.1